MTTETSNARGEWVLVPRVPTKAMIDAWRDAPNRWVEAYAAMLAAAPQPPSAPVGVEAIAAEIRASLGRGATVSTRRRWAVELEALAQRPAAVDGACAVAAIRFALTDPEGMTFLRLWNEGEFDTLRREWPDAPSEVYVGADPLATQHQEPTMTAETDLLPLPPLWICPNVEPADFPEVAKALIDYARANVAHATAPLQAEIEALRAEVERLKSMTAVTMGIGSGDGSLFVHGDYDSIKAAQALVFRAERLEEALRLALDSHGVMLMTDPPQDAWKVRRVEEIGRALLREQEEGNGQ